MLIKFWKRHMRFQKVDTGENFSFHAVFVHVCHFDGIIAEEISIFVNKIEPA